MVMRIYSPDMKTKNVLLSPVAFIGKGIGVVLSIGIALVPTALYVALWWAIPKRFWAVFLTTIAGVIFLVGQLIWALTVALFWDRSSSDESDEPPQ